MEVTYNGSIGAGWRTMLENTFDRLKVIDPCVGVIQVKVKLGYLRVFAQTTKAGHKIIDQTLTKADKTCEQCGSTNNIRRHFLQGEYKIRCDNCL